MLERAADPVFTNSKSQIESLITDTHSVKYLTLLLGSAALTAFLPADNPVLDAILRNSSPSVIAGNTREIFEVLKNISLFKKCLHLNYPF